MNDPAEFSLSAVNRKRGDPSAAAAQAAAEGLSSPSEPPRPGDRSTVASESAGLEGVWERLPFDPARLLIAVLRGWWKIVAGGVALGVVGALVGWLRFDNYYTATAQIIRRELPNSFRASDLGESFKPRQFSVGTVTAMMRSSSLLAEVGASASPPVSGRALAASLHITPERNTDLITISLRGTRSGRQTADLLNLYAQKVVDLTKGLQAQEAAELDGFLRAQLAKTESELAEASQELLAFSREASFFSSEREVDAYLRALNDAELRIQTARLEREALDFRIAAAEQELARQDPRRLKLAQARELLEELRLQYTDRNPMVMERQAAVDALTEQLESQANEPSDYQTGPNTVASSLGNRPRRPRERRRTGRGGRGRRG